MSPISSTARLLKRDPTLIPLFTAVGFGVCGALAFGVHYLRKSPDIVVRKSKNREPWNDVQPSQNTKLYSPNRSFWEDRQKTATQHPRAVFRDPNESSSVSLSETIKHVKDAACSRAHEKTHALFEKEKRECGMERRGAQRGSEEVKESSVMH